MALSRGEELISHRLNEEGRAHSRSLTLQIEDCLKEVNLEMKALDAVSFSHGPGSYTGLRIGLSVAKGLCYGLNIPLLSVDTLKSMALALQRQYGKAYHYWPMIDARRKEVYTAFYDPDLNPIRNIQALILEPGMVDLEVFKNKEIIVCGDASKKAEQILQSNRLKFSNVLCDARNSILPAHQKFELGDFEDLAYFKSLYLKAPNITRSRKTLF